MQEVVSVAAFNGVVAAIAPDGIVAAEPVNAFRVVRSANGFADIALEGRGVVRAEDAARVEVFPGIAVIGPAELVAAYPARGSHRAHHAERVHHGLGLAHQGIQRAEGLGRRARRADLHRSIRDREDIRIEMLHSRVSGDDVREKLAFDLDQKLRSSQAAEIVEAIRVLELDHLVGEDEVEGGAQHAAWHLDFGKATDPQVDVVEADRRTHEGRIVDGLPSRQTQGIGVLLVLHRIKAHLQGCPFLQRESVVDDARRIGV